MEILKISKELQGVFDSLPFYVMLVDSEHTILFTNRAINNQIDIPVDQMIGKYCPKIIHGLDHPTKECPLEEAFKKKCSIEKQVYDEKHDRWLISSVYITNFISSAGKEIFLHMIYDITDRKRAEKAVLESEEKFRNLFNNVQVGMFRILIDGSKILDTNKKFLEILGRTEEEIIGNPSLNLWAELHERDEMIRRLKKYGSIENFECRMMNKSGEVRNCIISSKYYPEIKLMEGSIVDYTEFRKAEEAVVKSEEKFRKFFNNAEIGMFRTLIDGSKILDANKKFLEIFSRSEEEVIGKPPIIHWAVPHEWEEMVRRLKKYGSIANLESKMVNKSGEVLHCIMSLKLHDGLGVLEGSIIDYTKQKKAEFEVLSLSKFPSENPNPILRFNSEGIIIYANESSKKLLDKWEKQVGQKVPDDWFLHITNIKSDGQIKNVEFDCDDICYLFTLKNVSEMGYINMYGVDITERKNFETLLQKSFSQCEILIGHRTKQLSDGYKLLKLILDSLPLGIDIIDEDGNVMYISPKMTKDIVEGKILSDYSSPCKIKEKRCKECPLNHSTDFGKTIIKESDNMHFQKTYLVTHKEIVFKNQTAYLRTFEDITKLKN